MLPYGQTFSYKKGPQASALLTEHFALLTGFLKALLTTIRLGRSSSQSILESAADQVLQWAVQDLNL
jgi:hypothetical protein